MKRITFMVGVVVFTALSAHARPVRLWQPEELYEKADVVIVGVVEQTRDTGRTATIRLGNNPPLPVRRFRATVRIVEILKGKGENSMVIEYAPLDWKAIKQPVGNGPGRFMVQRDKMYLLYLKRTAEGAVWVGALDGEFDDDQAVKLLPQQTEKTPNNGSVRQ